MTMPPMPTSANLPHISADRDFRAAIEACDELLKRKGHDYTQGAAGDEGLLRNFYRGGERFSLPALKVWGVYFFKHIDALETFVRSGRLESEPIEGRIFDAINYLLLLYKMVEHERRTNAPPAPGR